MTNLASSSVDVKTIIAQHLNYVDLSNFIQTCQSTAQLYHKNRFWKSLLDKIVDIQKEEPCLQDAYQHLLKNKFIMDVLDQHVPLDIKERHYKHLKCGQILFINLIDSFCLILNVMNLTQPLYAGRIKDCYGIYNEASKCLVVITKDPDLLIQVDTTTAATNMEQLNDRVINKSGLDISHSIINFMTSSESTLKFDVNKPPLRSAVMIDYLQSGITLGHHIYYEDQSVYMCYNFQSGLIFITDAIDYDEVLLLYKHQSVSTRILSGSEWLKLFNHLVGCDSEILVQIEVLTDLYSINLLKPLLDKCCLEKCDVLDTMLIQAGLHFN